MMRRLQITALSLALTCCQSDRASMNVPLELLLSASCAKTRPTENSAPSPARNRSGHFAHGRSGQRHRMGKQTVPAQSQASSEGSVPSRSLSLVVAQQTTEARAPNDPAAPSPSRPTGLDQPAS